MLTALLFAAGTLSATTTQPACSVRGDAAFTQESSDIIPHSRMMAALIELQRRFPDQVVIGFEEIFEAPPDDEPKFDLGPPGTSVFDALRRVRRLDARYNVDLLPGFLIHVYPAHGTADPAGLLAIRLHEFSLPPDDCLGQQMCCYMDAFRTYSYTPELGTYLLLKKEQWYRAHGEVMGGIVGSFMGDCLPADHRRPPIYHDITVRDALNRMALRSLQLANTRGSSRRKPISWRYGFRSDSTADTGLGGVPIFQTF
jgi:hypothetical protein